MGGESNTWIFETDDGPFFTRFTPNGLSRVRFPDLESAEGYSEETNGNNSFKIPEIWIERTGQAIRLALKGVDAKKLPPLDFLGTPFQITIWRMLLEIPMGQTRTYGEIARQLDKPGGARAVGRACGANPIPLLVPCHRVLASGSAIGGFSGGCGWKPLLLEREGWASGGDLPLFQNRNEPDSA